VKSIIASITENTKINRILGVKQSITTIFRYVYLLRISFDSLEQIFVQFFLREEQYSDMGLSRPTRITDKSFDIY
jgi:hypothetical protein